MSNELFSLLVRCWHDVQTDVTQLRVVRADTGEEVHLDDGTFLLRIFSDTDSPTQRCMIRHLATGREAYIQSGLTMRSFIKACLLAKPPSPDVPGVQADEQDTSKDT